MSKIDLTSKDWVNLVFDKRNKKYGAYLLRSESPKRHTLATLIIAAAAVVAFTIPMLLKIVMPEKEKMRVTEVTALSALPEAETKKEEQPKIDVAPPPPLKSSIKFTPPVIKKDAEVRDEEEIKAQADLNTSKASISIADVKGTDEEKGLDIAEVREVVDETPAEQKPYQVVEQMPSFPGGEKKLMEYLRDNIKYPVVALENGIQGRVVVRFVVSPSGQISNVEVLRGVDPTCDKEAMRLINAMPSWIPGKQNGVAVPVYFTIPIVFKIQ